MRFLAFITIVSTLYAGHVGDYLNIIPGNRWTYEGVRKDSVHSTIGFSNHPSIKSLKAFFPHFYSDTVVEYTIWDTVHIKRGFIYQGDTAYEREWIYSDELGHFDYSIDSLIEQGDSLLGPMFAFSDTTIYGTYYKIPFEIGKSWHSYPDTIFFEDLDDDGIKDTLWILEDLEEVIAKEDISVPYGNIKDAYKLRYKWRVEATYSTMEGLLDEIEFTGFEWHKPHLGRVRDTLYLEESVRPVTAGIDSVLYAYYGWLHRGLTSFAPGSLDVKEAKTPSSFALTAPSLSTREIRISYELPYSTEISIDVYDISGKSIRSLVTRYSSPGYYTTTWNGRDDNDKKVPAGIYFVRLLTPEYKVTRKIMLIR